MGGGYVYVLAVRRSGLRRYRLGRSAHDPQRLTRRFVRRARVLHIRWFDDAAAAHTALASTLGAGAQERDGLCEIRAKPPDIAAAFARAAAADQLARARRFSLDSGLFRDPADELPAPARTLAQELAHALAAGVPRDPKSLAALLHPVARGFALGTLRPRLKALGLPGELAPQVYAHALDGALGLRLKPDAAALAFALAAPHAGAMAAGAQHLAAVRGGTIDVAPLAAFAAAPHAALRTFSERGTLPGARRPARLALAALRGAALGAGVLLVEPAFAAGPFAGLLAAYVFGLAAIALGLLPGTGPWARRR